MFQCKLLAQLINWHARNRSEEGVLHIPKNSKAMKHIKNRWPDKFQDEPRSVRLGLALDGINPFSI